MRYLINVVYLLALLALSPWLVYKTLTTGKYRNGLKQKLLGPVDLPATDNGRRTTDQVAWFHAVSVGEIHLLRPIIARFRQRFPDWHCVVSATTDTGREEALKHFGDLPVVWWPFDFTWSVKRALSAFDPALIVLAEGELWPNFLATAKRHDRLVAVVNGRLSPRSYGRYRLLGRFTRWLLPHVDLFAVQTREYADNLIKLGVPADHVHVTGSVKYDGVTADRNNPKTAALRELLAVAPDDLVWIAGSTQAPEEEIVLDIYRRAKEEHPNLRLFLVPRQRERFEEVAGILKQSGLPFVRRSNLDCGQSAIRNPRSAIVLVDTIGELGALWGLADLAFVGGSLDGKRGGQNMIEPAAYGAAIVFGPHVWNFRETAARLVEAEGALQIEDARTLDVAVRRLLRDKAERARMGQAARDFVLQQQGATERTIQLLSRLMELRRFERGLQPPVRGLFSYTT